jgi:tetrahydromethanopterin S-methyltransferase subunit G
MDKFLNIFFQDPILLAAGIVVLVTIGILIWATQALRKPLSTAEMLAESGEDTPVIPAGNSGLFEARFQEITNQLAEISRRLGELETNTRKNPLDQTLPALPLNNEIQKSLQQIEQKIETLSSEKPKPHGDEFSRLEAKLEGIHRLLIFLTDSGGSSDPK